MKQLFISVLGLGILIGQVFTGTLPQHASLSGNIGFGQLIANDNAPSYPERLTIPAISVDTNVEAVGQDKDGRMGIPLNIYDAGWYGYGVKPGERGNAVIDGHVNTPKLTANIFTNLDKLQPGDSIMVRDAKNRTWNFEVTQVTHFSSDNFPLELVFGPADKAQLNLVTCGGFYQRGVDDYSQRTVVFSQLVGAS